MQEATMSKIFSKQFKATALNIRKQTLLKGADEAPKM